MQLYLQYKELCMCLLSIDRAKNYVGSTVQVVPHITDAIQDWIEQVATIPVDGKESVSLSGGCHRRY
ncbi:hypothetical protein L1987_29969 [Smallanthus sonchifolius]|uniref:Uncharacterized protein n=2 Tax=Smallanthus sonchifolius TaxID=185202 RepID=A0ACB9I2Y5_9ASTR|nr:hypothetical protein L1987_29967 [Smallanthus sonchifolius]KAI3801852.1 hypothetical protein L1987_29969 [Smallanthus sonchifolius]